MKFFILISALLLSTTGFADPSPTESNPAIGLSTSVVIFGHAVLTIEGPSAENLYEAMTRTNTNTIFLPGAEFSVRLGNPNGYGCLRMVKSDHVVYGCFLAIEDSRTGRLTPKSTPAILKYFAEK